MRVNRRRGPKTSVTCFIGFLAVSSCIAAIALVQMRRTQLKNTTGWKKLGLRIEQAADSLPSSMLEFMQPLRKLLHGQSDCTEVRNTVLGAQDVTISWNSRVQLFHQTEIPGTCCWTIVTLKLNRCDYCFECRMQDPRAKHVSSKPSFPVSYIQVCLQCETSLHWMGCGEYDGIVLLLSTFSIRHMVGLSYSVYQQHHMSAIITCWSSGHLIRGQSVFRNNGAVLLSGRPVALVHESPMALENHGRMLFSTPVNLNQQMSFIEIPFTRAGCLQESAFRNAITSSWEAAIEMCIAEKDCMLVTRRQVTGATYFCKDAQWDTLDVGWDTAVAGGLTGMRPLKGGSMSQATTTALLAECPQCPDGLHEVSTLNACFCHVCNRGSCPGLTEVLGVPLFPSFLSVDHHVRQNLIEKGLVRDNLRTFNPSLVIHGRSAVVAARLSNDTKCEARSIAGQFFPDNLDIASRRRPTSNFITLCQYPSLQLLEDPNTCKILELSREDVSNKEGLTLFLDAGNGLEDPRTFRVGGMLFIVASVGVEGPVPMRRMILLQLDDNFEVEMSTLLHRTWNRTDAPDVEKNWMPLVNGRTIYMVYSVCPFILCTVHVASGSCKLAYSSRCSSRWPSQDLLDHRGSTQLVRVHGKYLGVVHSHFTGIYGRIYHHRFILLSGTWPFKVLASSQPFALPAPSISRNVEAFQYVSGLDVQGRNVYLSYGISDCSSALVSFSYSLIFTRRFLRESDVPVVWWASPCNAATGAFCAGPYQVGTIQETKHSSFQVQTIYPVFGRRENALKQVPSKLLQSGGVHGIARSDVMVVHSSFPVGVITMRKVACSFRWPHRFLPLFMLRMAKVCTEVWAESKQEVRLFRQHGIPSGKVKHVPLTPLECLKCDEKAEADEEFAANHPQLSIGNRWRLLYIGDAIESSLHLMLDAFCSSNNLASSAVLVLLLPAETFGKNYNCPDMTLNGRLSIGATESSVLKIIRTTHVPLTSVMKSVDAVVILTRLSLYNSLMLQALACGKPLITLDHMKKLLVLPRNSVYFVPSHRSQRR